MKRRNLLLSGATLGMLAMSAHSASAVVLVQDGQPKATIVVEKDATPQLQKAAQTLQEYLQKSSGAKLPIAATPGNGASLYLGQSDAAKKAGIDAQKLDQDGFVLQGAGDAEYFIVGGSDWGTEFGVYDFLERYLGIRWLMPTDLGTDVPPHKTIDVPATKVLQEPVYLSRQLSPLNITADNPLGHWARFNRARGRIAFHHNLLNLFPVSKFGKTHPEFYPTLDGKLRVPAEDDHRWQPNLSAPGIVDAAVQQIEEYFEKNPEATSYSLGMNDSNLWDQTAASKARRNGKKNYLGLEDISDDYFLWANAVVERVLQKYPDKWFGTLAYNGIAEPPTKVSVHPRIVPFITYDRMRWEDPELRDFGHQLTERWAKVSPVLGWYDYAYGISYLTPRVYFHRMQQYLSWGAKHHVQFHYAELYPNWGEGPKPWVFTQLLWNPDQDVDALLNDWYRHFAGEQAAPQLRGFYDIWEKFWTQDIYKSKWNRDTGQYLPFNIAPGYLLDIPQSYITQSDAFMQQALRLADTPQRRARVAKLQQMWEFYKASIVTYQAENAVDAPAATPQNAAEALKTLDYAEDVMEQARKRRELLAAFDKDPLYSLSADYITRYPGTEGSNWGYSLMWRVLPWVEKSPELQARLQKMAQSSNNAVKAQADLILRTVNGKSKLVSTNASFEDGNIKGWTIWDKSSESETYHKGSFTVSSAQAASGKNSLLVKGLGRGAPMQNIPYQPGTYFARASCYVPKDSKVGTANLELQVQGPDGKAKTGKFRVPSSNIALRPGTWANIVIPFTLPADPKGEAKSVRLLLLIDGFEPDGEIYLDDVGIYRLED